MNLLPRLNFLLTLLLSIGLIIVYFQTISIGNLQKELQQQVLLLETKRVDSSEILLPEAGESGKIDINSVKAYVDAKIAQVALTSLETTSTSAVVKPQATPIPKKIVTYEPVFSQSFVTTSTDWVDVEGSDFEFSVGEYGSSSYISWDGVIFIQGGSGEVHARLFDVTHGVGVQGSEITGTSAKASLVSSSRLNFFSGNNTYRVQLKSLTSSPVQFNYGRVKVVY